MTSKTTYMLPGIIIYSKGKASMIYSVLKMPQSCDIIPFNPRFKTKDMTN